MYGKKRIVFARDDQIVFAGGGSWGPIGWLDALPDGTVQARMLKEEFEYRRPTAPYMYYKIKAPNRKALKLALNKKYNWVKEAA